MRRFALATIATLGGFGIAVACADPYDGEIPGPAPPARDSGLEDTGASTDDASEDASVAVDAGSDADPCDRDRDGFREKSDACGGDDCDDDDDRAHPDSGFLSALPTTKTQGDWDCSGQATKQFKDAVTCLDQTNPQCPQVQGFNAPIGCGQSGQYVMCNVILIMCQQDKVEDRVQGCR